MTKIYYENKTEVILAIKASVEVFQRTIGQSVYYFSYKSEKSND